MNAPPAQASTLRAAVAAHGRGDFRTAERLYREVLQQDGGSFEALHNLGHVLVQSGRDEEAAALFERALARREDAPATHNMLAQALRGQGRYEQALAHYRRAIALRPDYAQARHDLGQLLQALGRMDEARAAIETALTLAPKRGAYYRSLGEIVRFGAEDPYLAAMETLVREAGTLPTIDRIELHFALGKAWADLGRPAEAFGQYAEGAAVLRRHVRYDERATLGMFDHMAAAVGAEVMQAKAGLGHPSEQPIFILGMPRSGSTLVEQILAGHPAVSARGELTAFRDVAAARLGDPKAVRDLDGAGLRALGAAYLDRARPLRPGALRVTDKMPGNFHFLGLIRLALPRARIIHTVRDPLDTCVSCFTTLFLDGHQYSNDLAELGRYYRGYERLMEHWRRVSPGGVLEVRYEEVVADLEGQARRIVEYCGLDWDPACLAFQRADRAVWTASAGQVRRPLYAGSVGRAKVYQRWLGPLLTELGKSERATGHGRD